MEALTVTIVSPDPLTKMGLKHLLEDFPIRVLEDDPLLATTADVLLWDGKPDEGTLIDQPILVLLADTEYPSALQPARAVLSRAASAEQIVAALFALQQGLVVIAPEFLEAGVLLSAEEPPDHFTPRELEVLQQLARGLSNKAIAKTLDISENTVKFHVAALLEKFGASSRTEAVIQAIATGLVHL